MDETFKEKEVLKEQICPVCLKKTLTLMEGKIEIHFFGDTYIFSMDCDSCKYHMADLESAEKKPAYKKTIEISSEEDMNIRIIKSGAATLKIPHITTITPGPASEGYITNVEGILNRIKDVLEQTRDSTDDDTERKKAKNLLKKIQNIKWGREKIKLTIEDPTGNSAIISEKAS